MNIPFIPLRCSAVDDYFILLFCTRLIELEVAAGVVVRDVLHHTSKCLHVARQQALLHVVAEQVAEYAAEVLMTRITQE